MRMVQSFLRMTSRTKSDRQADVGDAETTNARPLCGRRRGAALAHRACTAQRIVRHAFGPRVLGGVPTAAERLLRCRQYLRACLGDGEVRRGHAGKCRPTALLNIGSLAAMSGPS